MQHSDIKRPLEGIRVLECGIFHAGPGCPAILGDLGAEVIKIENPSGGDPVRRSENIGNISFDLPGNRTVFCEGSNRNKKSVTVDLETSKGQEIVYRLARRSDVFLTNMRPQAVEKMNITYSILSKINPSLIYATVSAFGPRGPDRERGGFDYHAQARSGWMYSMGEAGMPPMVCQFGIIDQATAMMASQQIITALYMRERFGIAQEVHASLLGTAISLLHLNILLQQMGGIENPGHNRSTAHPLRNYYKCGDDRWIMITLTPPDRFWRSLCLALGHPELENDPRFKHDDSRFANAAQLVAILDEIFVSRPRDEWLRVFSQYDLFYCAVNLISEMVDDPQVLENGYIVDFEHPTLGELKIPGYPGHFSKSWAQTTRAAPELGEHTEKVLMELGGFRREEISRMRDEGVI